MIYSLTLPKKITLFLKTFILLASVLMLLFFLSHAHEKRALDKYWAKVVSDQINFVSILNNESSDIPTLIYSEEIREERTDNRYWPVVRIMRKIGESDPELLAEVGKVGEYASSYVLSPDKKYLLINLESKLQILDLTTKELKDLFIPKRQVMSISYSPDSKHLFIWDQKYVPDDGINSYYVHLFTISNGKSRIIKQGNLESYYGGTVWRNDGKVVLSEFLGEVSYRWYYDLLTNKMVKSGENYHFGFISGGGKTMSVVGGWVDDACNGFSGSSTGIFDIIEPISGNFLRSVDGLGKIITPVSFSPDEKEFLYAAEETGVVQSDCLVEQNKDYFIFNIANGGSQKVLEPLKLMKKWGTNYAGYHLDFNNMNGKNPNSIILNGRIVVTSDNHLRIVAQFFK